MIRPIIRYGDEILAKRAAEIEEIDDEVGRLVEDLADTMHADEYGVGLAANQVGVPRRVAVIDLSRGERPEDLIVLINPRIVEAEGEEVCDEGCLSFPELSVKIKRPRRVKVTALNLEGQEYVVEGEGVLARALCHELDHIDGVLIIDRIKGLAKEMALTEIKRLKRQGFWD